MIRHIVFYNVKEEFNQQNKTEIAQTMKSKLESLVGKIPEIIKMEVNSNVNPNGYDVCLYSEFNDIKSLELYQANPLHQEVRKYIHQVIIDRVVTDCII